MSNIFIESNKLSLSFMIMYSTNYSCCPRLL